jgi:hypothetical protein
VLRPSGEALWTLPTMPESCAEVAEAEGLIPRAEGLTQTAEGLMQKAEGSIP